MSENNSQGYKTRVVRYLESYVLWGSWSTFFLINVRKDFSKVIRDKDPCGRRNSSRRRFFGWNYLSLSGRSGQSRWWRLRCRKNMGMGTSIRMLTFDRRHLFKNLSHNKCKRVTELKNHETLRPEISVVSEWRTLFAFLEVCLGLAQQLEPAFDPRK